MTICPSIKLAGLSITILKTNTNEGAYMKSRKWGFLENLDFKVKNRDLADKIELVFLLLCC